MNVTNSADTKALSLRRLGIPMLVGALTGLAAGWGLKQFGGLDWMVNLITPNTISGLILGVFILLTSMVCFVTAFSPEAVARAYKVAPGEDVHEEVSLLKWSAVDGLFYGVFLLALSFAGRLDNLAVGVVMAVSLLAVIAINFYLWRRYDELWREITAHACTTTFIWFHYILLGWAALAILLDGAGFGPVNVVSALLGVFTIATIRATAQRGMANLG